MTQLLWLRGLCSAMAPDAPLNDETWNLARYCANRLTHGQKFTLYELLGVFDE